MPALRLKTKLVIAITGMVAAIVATIAGFYVAEGVRQRILEAYNTSLLIERQVFSVARGALEADLPTTKIDLKDQVQVAAATEEILQTDNEQNALTASAMG